MDQAKSDRYFRYICYAALVALCAIATAVCLSGCTSSDSESGSDSGSSNLGTSLVEQSSTGDSTESTGSSDDTESSDSSDAEENTEPVYYTIRQGDHTYNNVLASECSIWTDSGATVVEFTNSSDNSHVILGGNWSITITETDYTNLQAQYAASSSSSSD